MTYIPLKTTLNTIMKLQLQLLILLLVSISNGVLAQTNYNLSDPTLFDGEPSIAVNPANQHNIIAGWMKLRADEKVWIATKASFDRGQTWSTIHFMPHDTVANGSADVAIAFHNSGIAYLSWINFRTNPDTAGAVFLSKSADGGLTWQTPNKVIDEKDTPDLPFDRPWVAVDNSGGATNGMIYVTTMSAYWQAGQQHHIYLRTSADGGLTWSTVKQVDNTAFSVGSLNASYGAISIGKDGRAYIAYMSYDVSVSPYVRYYSATTDDAGLTFQRKVVDTVFINAGSDFTRGWCLKANPAINGNAILTWIDNRYGDYDVVVSKTMDGGITWTKPLRVNDDALNNGMEQDMVWADFSPSGNLALAWRDRRLNGTGSTVPFDIYIASSTDGVTTFSPNLRVTTVASPYFLVPQGNSFIGLAATDSSIYTNWGDYRNTPVWNIYFNKTDLTTLTTGVTEVASETQPSLELFPNPAADLLQVVFSAPAEYNTCELFIFNAAGQVMKKTLLRNNGSAIYSGQMDISLLKNGTYFVFIKNKHSFFTNKMFVKRY